MASVVFPSLEMMLSNMSKTKARKSFITKYGKSQKAIDFNDAIEKLNKKYNTSFYIEHENRAFVICGHREYGTISRRSGSLNQDVTMTLGSKELKKAGYENTIKMIVDDQNNYIIVSLVAMRNLGLLEDDSLSKHRGGVRSDSGRFFYSWSLEELYQLNTIPYFGVIK